MGQWLHSLGSGPVIYGAVLAFGLVIKWGWDVLQSGSVRQMNAGARLFQAKRYAEAETHFRALLTRRLPAGVEADTRRRLADTLDVLGKTEEAAEERNRASAVAMNSKRDPMALSAQGDLLKRQNRYDEACEIYQQALRLYPPARSSGRALVMAKLTLAHFDAGRSSETLKWAKASLASGPAKDIRGMMERMAGVASADQGDLEEAETHYIRALELAELGEKSEDIALCLTLLANLQYKQGRYEEAIAAAQRSRNVTQSPARIDISVEAECLRDMGRFDEARAVMRRHFDGPHFDQPHVERRMEALGSMGMAWIEARAEQPEAAWEHLEAAREGLKVVTDSATWPPPPGVGEEKLILWCDATAVNILAQQGRASDARRLMDSVESRLARFSSDNATLRGTYSHLTRAALQMGDLAESRRFCQCYLESRPVPSSLPFIYYHFGEISLRLGETQAAREAFQQAIAPGIDSLDARRAQARLAEIGE